MISLNPALYWFLVSMLYAIIGIAMSIYLKPKIQQVSGRKGVPQIPLAIFIAFVWPVFLVIVVVSIGIAIKRKWI